MRHNKLKAFGIFAEKELKNHTAELEERFQARDWVSNDLLQEDYQEHQEIAYCREGFIVTQIAFVYPLNTRLINQCS